MTRNFRHTLPASLVAVLALLGAGAAHAQGGAVPGARRQADGEFLGHQPLALAEAVAAGRQQDEAAAATKAAGLIEPAQALPPQIGRAHV